MSAGLRTRSPSPTIRVERDRAALRRAAELDADRIRVRTEDGHVTLSGTVRSLAEKQEAGLAKGVTHVTNNLEIRPY